MIKLVDENERRLVMIRTGRLLCILFLSAACNLSSAPIPTPTAQPPPLATPTLSTNPTSMFGGGTPSPTSTCPDTPPGWIAYIVEPGDSLGLLAEQTDSTIREIADGNCIDDADTIVIGTVLYLPRVPVVAPPGGDANG